jgi:hypothetical protein
LPVCSHALNFSGAASTDVKNLAPDSVRTH